MRSAVGVRTVARFAGPALEANHPTVLVKLPRQRSCNCVSVKMPLLIAGWWNAEVLSARLPCPSDAPSPSKAQSAVWKSVLYCTVVASETKRLRGLLLQIHVQREIAPGVEHLELPGLAPWSPRKPSFLAWARRPPSSSTSKTFSRLQPLRSLSSPRLAAQPSSAFSFFLLFFPNN